MHVSFSIPYKHLNRDCIPTCIVNKSPKYSQEDVRFMKKTQHLLDKKIIEVSKSLFWRAQVLVVKMNITAKDVL